MKIALVGYGKMGKKIEEIAQKRGHEIVAKLNETPTESTLNKPDVVIEFTRPEAAFNNVTAVLKLGIPVVSGTTGWAQQLESAKNEAVKYKTSFIQSSNFSLGVNLFFAITDKVSQIMSNFPNYSCKMEEIHHTEKKDAPSGTAITAAEIILRNDNRFINWKLGESDGSALGIQAIREDQVPGTHSIFYNSPVDEIMIKHTAHSRDGFAEGAVLAAEFIFDKKGVFTMQDVLQMHV